MAKGWFVAPFALQLVDSVRGGYCPYRPPFSMGIAAFPIVSPTGLFYG